jgi:type VI secretion system protein ImpG
MNPKLIHYYSQELQHLRDMGGEFAAEFPKIAGRLGLEEMDCADPYVERLLEGFSLLAARVQLKIDAEFPRFTQHITEIVYPNYLRPTPSMAVVRMDPDLANPALASGYPVPRGSALRSLPGKDEVTSCEYRTAHDVVLWPLTLVEAGFFTHGGRQGGVDLPLPPGVKGGLRLRLRTNGLQPLSALPVDRLCLHIQGSDGLPFRIYEQLLAGVKGILVLPVKRPASWHLLQPKSSLTALGFSDDEALLPVGRRTFGGYRLLQEYFSFPQRYQFIEIADLAPAFRQCHDQEIEILVLLDRSDAALAKLVDCRNFSLNCTPAINLFPRRGDRIALSNQHAEFHVLPDRTRPMDFEVFQLESVTGYGLELGKEQSFQPFYTAKDLRCASQPKAFYQLRREPRVASSRHAHYGPRSSYIGSESFISLVDADNAPYRSDLRQLGLDILCTNRDLPLTMALGASDTDFTLDAAAPVVSVRCVAGPSVPVASFADGNMAWRLLNNLSLNYLSLADTDPEQGASALRELLALYATATDTNAQRQIQGARSIVSKQITRRLPSAGPIVFGRGLEVSLLLDDAAFEGSGAFLLGAVLERFFGQYASINSFTETVIRTPTRGEIMRWPARSGSCATL